MAPAVHARRALSRPLRAAVLLAAILGWIWCLAATLGTTFAATTVTAPVVDRPVKTSAEAREAASAQKAEREPKGTKGKFNHTLLLDTARPSASGAPTGNSLPWATCIVEYPTGAAGAEGEASAGSGHALETWVMRGDRDVVSAFALWRNTAKDTMPTSVRCSATNLASTDEVRCIECVSTTAPHTVASGAQVREGIALFAGMPQGSSVLPFGGLSQCLARTAYGAGFCKSGILRI